MRSSAYFIAAFAVFCCLFTCARSEYFATDDPPCQDDCLSKQGAEREACLETLLDFHSYRLVKSLFNFGKASIYFGLWNLRYSKPNPKLMGDIFDSTLTSYNDANILGILNFDDLRNVSMYTFSEFSPYMNLSRSDFNYEVIPSLKCPVTCSYDLLSWQTLFYTSLAVFVLAVIAVGLYSIFLYKQYQSLKRRLKVTKNTKAN